MRFIFIVAFLSSSIIGTSYWYAETEAICPVPIVYSIGEVDERFLITREELKAIAEKAEAVWEQEVESELFVYDEKAKFKINLIFDERQQLATTEEEWRINLDRTVSENQAEINRIATLNEDYQRADAEYQAKRSEYEIRLASYNAKVDEYNREGGAPAPVFAELQAEERGLNRLVSELTVMERNLNESVGTINRLGEEINDKIALYNQEVAKYNEIFGSLETFTQGDFARKRINIYKFSDVPELTRVLTHEFGHALGLPHVEGEDSIMYYLTTNTDSLLVSPNDKSALVVACKDSDSLSAKVRRVIREVIAYF
jgi:uncharacterized small protein (DUF1192 family)